MKRVDIKTGFLCNNNCLFCVQADNKCTGNRSFEEIKKDLTDSKKRCDEVVFTGGEVSIRKDFFDLVKLAKNLGYSSIQIQSNGRMFSDLEYAKKAVQAGANEFGLALHGYCREQHDFLTQASGSFSQTVKAIQNLKSLGARVLTNTVVVKPNFRDLEKIAKLLVKLDVDQYQFAFVHAMGNAWKNYESIMPNMTLAAAYIKKGLDIGIRAGKTVMSEAVPYCMMQGYEDYLAEKVIPDTEIRGKEFQNTNDFGKQRRNDGKMKFPQCETCMYFSVCEGPWKEYPQRMGNSEFKPVRKKDYALEGYDGSKKDWEETRAIYLKLINKSGKIIDLGCGSGMLLEFILRNKNFDLEPFGIDISKEAIEKAKQKFSKYKNNFILENIGNFKTEKKFDYIIISSNTLDSKISFDKILNMLNRGGKIIAYQYEDDFSQKPTRLLSEIKRLGLPPPAIFESPGKVRLVSIGHYEK